MKLIRERTRQRRWSVHLLIAIAAQHGLVLKQADIETAFLHARTPADAAPTYVIPPKGFE